MLVQQSGSSAEQTLVAAYSFVRFADFSAGRRCIEVNECVRANTREDFPNFSKNTLIQAFGEKKGLNSIRAFAAHPPAVCLACLVDTRI